MKRKAFQETAPNTQGLVLEAEPPSRRTPGTAAATQGKLASFGGIGTTVAPNGQGHGGTLAAALAYAGAGIPVFPCGADKTPKPTIKWRDAATTDAVQIKSWCGVGRTP